MEQSEDFWALRTCFLPPIPELSAAADLLDEAADALLAGDHDRACARLREANIPTVHAFAARIMGSWDPVIHRRRLVERPSEMTKAATRKPNQTAEAGVFARDGWRCRYCGVRVVLPKARKVLVDTFPDVVCWSGRNKDLHAAFFALSAVVDHVVPHTLGGSSNADNLVTTCQCCNYGKGDRLLTEVGLIDPLTRTPIVDAWDGLGRLLGNRNRAAAVVLTPATESSAPGRVPTQTLSPKAWFAEFDHLDADLSRRLLTLLTDCEDLGVSWTLDKYLMIRLTVGKTLIHICGVARDGEITVPWYIGDQKEHFRYFAETIKSALPEALVHESAKQWIVTRDGKNRLHVRDLLKISPVLRDAIGSLAARISNAQNAVL